MQDTALTQLGIESPAEVFESFQAAGNDMLLKLRKVTSSPNAKKTLRHWGIVDAAKMIGTSAPTLRKMENESTPLDPPTRDSNNRRVYSLERINKARDVFKTRYHRPINTDPIISCITNFKGGSGKTVSTVHLAQKCALEGLRVLLIDFDPQATSTFIAGGIVPDLELSSEDTINTTLIKDPSDITKVIHKTYFHGLDLIPANLAIQDLELALPNSNINHSQELGSPALRLKQAIQNIKDNYDVILIDCGPNLGILTINALLASNTLLIPIPPNMFDYASFIMLTGTLKNLFKAIPSHSFDLFKLMLTKHSGSNEANQVENMIRTQFGGFIATNHMCNTVEIEKATNDLGTVYEIAKPRGGREAYRRAMLHLDSLNLELIDYFKQVWANKSQNNQMGSNELELVANGQ